MSPPSRWKLKCRTDARVETRGHLFGIVIPVHNEEDCLLACLESISLSVSCAVKEGRCATVAVVLDRCSDRSAEIAMRFPMHVLTVDAGSVGRARAIGADWVIGQGATWLAFTDADTVVAQDWLMAQEALGSDAVCGTVQVRDWHLHHRDVRRAYEAVYQDRDGHRHIHGANLGLTTEAYLACGGFESLRLDEDVRLVERLMGNNFQIAWSASPRASTSARIRNRVGGGFGGRLRDLNERLASGASPQPSSSQSRP